MQVYLGYGNPSDNTSHQLLSFKYVGNLGEVCQWAIHDLICPMGCIVFPEILLQVLLLKNCMTVCVEAEGAASSCTIYAITECINSYSAQPSQSCCTEMFA